MAEIIPLGIDVDTRTVNKATADLAKLTDAIEETGDALEGLEGAAEGADDALGDAGKRARETETRFTGTADGAARAGRGIGAFSTAVHTAAISMAGFGAEIMRMQGAVQLLVGGLAAYTGGQVIGALQQTTMSLQQMEMTFMSVSGSAEAAAGEMDYVMRTADAFGQSAETAGRSYAKMLAAAQGAGISLQDTRNTFEGLTAAATTFGLTAYELDGVLNAVQQMMSKGSVQAEELRGQLGERLPGTFAIAARAMGMTTQELNKALELGQVKAAEFVPKLGALLKEMYGGMAQGAENAAKALNEFENVMFRLETIVVKGGFQSALGSVYALLADLGNSQLAQAMATALGGAFAAISAAVEGLRVAFDLLEPAITFVVAGLAGQVVLRGLTAFVTAIGAASAAVGGLTGVFRILIGVMATNPFTAAILGATLLYEALAPASDEMVTFGKVTAEYGVIVAAVMAELGERIGDTFTAMVDWVVTWGETLAAAIGDVRSFVNGAIGLGWGLAQSFYDIFSGISRIVAAALTDMVNGAVAAGAAVRDGLTMAFVTGDFAAASKAAGEAFARNFAGSATSAVLREMGQDLADNFDLTVDYVGQAGAFLSQAGTYIENAVTQTSFWADVQARVAEGAQATAKATEATAASTEKAAEQAEKAARAAKARKKTEESIREVADSHIDAWRAKLAETERFVDGIANAAMATLGAIMEAGSSNGGIQGMISGATGLVGSISQELMRPLSEGFAKEMKDALKQTFGETSMFKGTMLEGVDPMTIGAVGAGIGNALVGVVNGNVQQIGSGIGMAAGSAIGSFFGPIGTMIGGALGSLAGGLLGGLFGGGKPSDKTGTYTINRLTGAGTEGGFTGKKFSQANRDAATALAEGASELATGIEDLFKVTDRMDQIVGIAGSRDGAKLFYGEDGRTTQLALSAEAGTVEIFANVVRGMKEVGTLTEAQADIMLTAAARAGESMDTLNAELARFAALDDLVKRKGVARERGALGQQIDALEATFSEANRTIMEAFGHTTAQIEAARSEMQRRLVDDANNAVLQELAKTGYANKSQIEAYAAAQRKALDAQMALALKEAAELPGSATLTANIKALFAAKGKALDAEIADMIEGIGSAATQTRRELNAMIASSVSALTPAGMATAADLKAYAAAREAQIRADYDARVATAKAAGATTAELELIRRGFLALPFRQLSTELDDMAAAIAGVATKAEMLAQAEAERASVMQDLVARSRDLRAAEKTLADARASLSSSDLAPGDEFSQLAALRGRFNAAIGQATGGGADAAAGATAAASLAQELLRQGQTVFGANTDYAALYAAVDAALKQAGVSVGAQAGAVENKLDADVFEEVQQRTTNQLLAALAAIDNRLAGLREDQARATAAAQRNADRAATGRAA